MLRIVIGTLALCAVASTARAAEPDEASDSGGWIVAAARGGPMRASYEFTAPANPGFGVNGDVTLEDAGFGVGLNLEVSGGVHPSANFGLGLGGDLIVGGPTLDLGDSTLGPAIIVGAKAQVVWRSERELWLSLGPGWAQAHFVSSTDDIGSAENVFEPETANGPSVSLGIGFRALSVQLFAARLTSEHGVYLPLLASVGGRLYSW